MYIWNATKTSDFMLLFTIIIEAKGIHGMNTDVGRRLDICAMESYVDWDCLLYTSDAADELMRV